MRLTPTDRSMVRKCYISAPVGTDLTVLTQILEQHGYSVLALEDLASGYRWIDAFSASIARANLVLGVFPRGLNSANVAFEIGWGAAMGKQVMVIASAEVEDVPFAVSSLLVVRAEPDAVEAINFALDNLRSSITPHHPVSSNRQARSAQLSDVERYRNLYLAVQTEDQRAMVLKQLLLDSGLDVVANAQYGKSQVDLAVWSDELGAYVGNPLIVPAR